MFVAGMLTILLPCILPLVPIVLGVSIAGRSKWRPLLTITGMLVSFVGFTFLLNVVLNQFITLADYIRISTFYILLLFGFGFLTHNKTVQLLGAVLGGFFFWDKGWIVMTIVQTVGATLMEVGGWIATRIQQFGSNIQTKTSGELGRDNPLSAFIIGLTMGLVWVPCAGPARGFALTLVREQPGFQAAALLFAYGFGTAVPLTIIGYGGQAAAHSTRALSRYSGKIKQVSGVILICTAVALNYNWLRNLEIFLVSNTGFGNIGVDLEEKLFGEEVTMPEEEVPEKENDNQMESNKDVMPVKEDQPKRSALPIISTAPEFQKLGEWHNSEPLTLESLRGKVVLVDFWTYSCINCIRTLPYLQGYWEKYKDKPFVLLGVHTPEFVFEKSNVNLAKAIAEHGLTYPIVQDNDYGTWRAFENRYWPAKYLIDAEGNVRYTHFGEGAYEETDMIIAQLLQEIGVDADEESSVEEVSTRGKSRSPETYLGRRSWDALRNGPERPVDGVQKYIAPESLDLHQYALVGSWELIDGEQQVLRSAEGEIRMKFLGFEINLVLGPPDEGEGMVDVIVDGKTIKTLTIDFDNLYNLWTGEYGEHDIVLRIRGEGTSGYAFTFGG